MTRAASERAQIVLPARLHIRQFPPQVVMNETGFRGRSANVSVALPWTSHTKRAVAPSPAPVVSGRRREGCRRCVGEQGRILLLAVYFVVSEQDGSIPSRPSRSPGTGTFTRNHANRTPPHEPDVLT
ncbi:hypothetical protein MTO96_001377 [Rhipicephalus appendiculatus]